MVRSVPDEHPPSFSIVVPTFEGRDTICETLQAIAKLETSSSVEVIVVVDGSSDGTTDLVRKLDGGVPSKVIEQSKCGSAAARNRGAAEATGDVLLFLDDDMICSPDLLHKHARSFGEGADAVLGSFTESGSPITGMGDDSGELRHSQPESGPIRAVDMYGGHLAVRRSVFEQLGGYDAAFTEGRRYGCEDFDFGYRLLRRFKVVRNTRALCHHHKSLTPRQYLARARSSAVSEALLLAKHPELRDEIVAWTGASSRSNRLIALSRIPAIPHLAASAVAAMVSIGCRTPLRSSRLLTRLCHASYAWSYWAAVRSEGALPELWS